MRYYELKLCIYKRGELNARPREKTVLILAENACKARMIAKESHDYSCPCEDIVKVIKTKRADIPLESNPFVPSSVLGKWLKRFAKSVRKDRYVFRHEKTWHGMKVLSEPLFASYGKIGQRVSIYMPPMNFVCQMQYDWEMDKLILEGKQPVNLFNYI